MWWCMSITSHLRYQGRRVDTCSRPAGLHSEFWASLNYTVRPCVTEEGQGCAPFLCYSFSKNMLLKPSIVYTSRENSIKTRYPLFPLTFINIRPIFFYLYSALFSALFLFLYLSGTNLCLIFQL